MNAESIALCEKLVPSAYIQQGCQAKKIRENQIRTLIQHVSFIIKASTVIVLKFPTLFSFCSQNFHGYQDRKLQMLVRITHMQVPDQSKEAV